MTGQSQKTAQGGELYYCPRAEEVESAAHGGFDQCCGKPELHVPLPDGPGTQALSELLTQRKREIHAAQSQTDAGLREQYGVEGVSDGTPYGWMATNRVWLLSFSPPIATYSDVAPSGTVRK